MLRKLNITLGILCLIGAMFIGGMLLYEHFDDAESSKVANKVNSEVHYVEER